MLASTPNGLDLDLDLLMNTCLFYLHKVGIFFHDGSRVVWLVVQLGLHV